MHISVADLLNSGYLYLFVTNSGNSYQSYFITFGLLILIWGYQSLLWENIICKLVPSTSRVKLLKLSFDYDELLFQLIC